MSLIHGVDRGTGTPKDEDEVNRREIIVSLVAGVVVTSEETVVQVRHSRNQRYSVVYYESIK